eukprot:2904686-Amphidinium_carterae.1
MKPESGQPCASSWGLGKASLCATVCPNPSCSAQTAAAFRFHFILSLERASSLYKIGERLAPNQ